MNAREQAELRDAVARARLVEGSRRCCVGCGGDLEARTEGCTSCTSRWSKRRRREGEPPSQPGRPVPGFVRVENRLVHYTNASNEILWAEIVRLRDRLARVKEAVA